MAAKSNMSTKEKLELMKKLKEKGATPEQINRMIRQAQTKRKKKSKTKTT
jgi:hypothetical protein